MVQLTHVTNVPRGTTVYSALVLHHRLLASNSIPRTLGQFRSDPALQLSAFRGFAVGSATVWGALFPYLPTTRAVFEQHTFFGAFSNALDPEQATSWAAEVAVGNTATQRRYTRTVLETRLFDEELSYCPQCMLDELLAIGYAHWHCLHQLSAVRVCYKHGVPLLHRCGACGAVVDNGQSARLPSDNCHRCGCSPERTVARGLESAGEVQLARNLALLYGGNVPHLRPVAWAALVRRASRQTGGLRALLRGVQEELSRTWSIGASGASCQLSLICAPRIEKQLALLSSPGDILPKLAIYGALHGLGLVHAATDGAPLFVGDPLEEGLARHGLPLGLADALLSGHPRSQVARLANTSIARLDSMLKGLPMALQLKIDESRPSTCRLATRTAHTPYRLPRHAESEAVVRQVYRAKLLFVLSHWESPSRTLLRKKLRQVTHWLSKHDSEWLERHLPPKHTNTRRRK